MPNTVIFISGITGSGKTSVVRALSGAYGAYLEDTLGNDQLQHLLAGDLYHFDARLNQKWFLEQLAQQVAALQPFDIVVIDQSPEVIIGVYTYMFLQDGLLRGSDFAELARTSEHVLQRIHATWPNRVDIILECDPGTALRRALRRDGIAPNQEWIERCDQLLRDVISKLRSPLRVDTTILTLESVISQTMQILTDCGVKTHGN